ncbi:MAG TPA: hypothetical protein VM490_16635, partial [Armatimonadaceae bacterium]|nr:hypothetical protein [Armatimonadaceae bacterium]
MNPTEPRHRNPARRPRLTDAEVGELLNLGYADALEEGRRADTKAGHLLTVFGVLVAAVAAVASRGGLPLGSTVVLWVSAAPIATAFIRLLLAIRPQIEGHPLAHFASCPPADVLRTFETEYESGTYY